MKRLSALVLVLTTAAVAVGFAQETLRPRIGIFGGLSISTHSADFRALPGVPNCCPGFDGGSGLGPILGVGYETPISSSLLLSLNAGYVDHSALLSTRESVVLITGGEIREGAFEHTIDASLASIGIEPLLSYRLMEGLFVRGGLRVGAMLSSSYAQREAIVEPATAGAFLDSLGNDSGERVRNASSGDIPDAGSLLMQGIVGAEYELPINASETLLLTPGISYALSFTDVVNGYSWKPNALRLTVGLKYSPLPAKPVQRDTLYMRDTTFVTIARSAAPSLRLEDRKTSKQRIEEADYIVEHVTVSERYISEVPKAGSLSSAVTAVGVENEREEPVATLRIEEFLQINAHPLLGYIFFDEGSAEIPSRYPRLTQPEADRFLPASLFGEDALGISRHVLNIVGHNLRRHPDARLTITGCNANGGIEEGNRTLSRNRAESVRDYLVNVWKIAPERLTTVERDLPEIPSNTRTQDGAEENRRVEIASDVQEVTDLFIAYDTTRTASPPTLRIRPVVRSSDPVASWKLVVSQRGAVLKEFSGTGAPPATIDWEIAAEREGVPRFEDPILVDFEAATNDGEKTDAHSTLATDLVTIQRKAREGTRDYRIEQYSLVLFDVGTSTITDAHRRTTDLIRSRLEPGSTLTIEGFSDRSGDADANRRLALARAQATAKALGQNDAKVVGIGEDRLLHSNDLPEGRFYCRTVRITVKTPIQG